MRSSLKRLSLKKMTSKEQNRKYYLNQLKKDPESYKKASQERNKKIRADNQQKMILYLLEHPCVDCGMSNPICLHPDHINPETKSFQIGSKMSKYNWEKILIELKKCEIRCANCHMIRTSIQFGWYKAVFSATTF